MTQKVMSYTNKVLISAPCECCYRDCRKNKCNHPENLGYVKNCMPEVFPFGCPLDTYLTMDELDEKLGTARKVTE